MSKKYIIDFDFLGKDSVHYKNSVEISKEVWEMLSALSNGKSPTDNLFDITSADVNSFIKEVIPFGSAKLFRTAVGSSVAAEALKAVKINKDDSLDNKIKAFNEASLKISTLLNHQKGVSKNFEEQSKKMDEKLQDARKKARQSEKKHKKQIEELKERLKYLKDKYTGAELKKRKAQISERINHLEERISKSKSMITTIKEKVDFKKKTSNIALGTAKSAYFDPRVVVSFAKYYEIPIEKLYSKALLKKFEWAMDTPEEFFLTYGEKK